MLTLTHTVTHHQIKVQYLFIVAQITMVLVLANFLAERA